MFRGTAVLFELNTFALLPCPAPSESLELLYRFPGKAQDVWPAQHTHKSWGWAQKKQQLGYPTQIHHCWRRCPFHCWPNTQALNGEGGKAVLAGARTQLNTWLLCRGQPSLGTTFQSCFSWFCPFHILLPSITGCLAPPSRFLKLSGSSNIPSSTRDCCIWESQRAKPYNC